MAALVAVGALSGCDLLGVSGPPLVVLKVAPVDGGGLPAGETMELTFNLPVDASSLEGRLTVSPSCELSVVVQGSQVRIAAPSAQPGRVYVFRVRPGVRGLRGETLRHTFETSVVVLPEGSSWGEDPPPPTGGGPGMIATGAALLLEDAVVGACDLPGSYSVPRFDRVRIYLAERALPAGTLPALLASGAGEKARLMEASIETAPGRVELVLREEVRIGGEYECVLVSRTSTGEDSVEHVWSFAVGGLPWNRVWALDIATGQATPVGRAMLGYELAGLVGDETSVIAVGRPGGRSWHSLYALQQLSSSLAPLGQPVAAYRDSNHLAGQFQSGVGVLVVVGPEVPPPLVGQPQWTGYVPAVTAGSPERSAIIATGRGGFANTLLAGKGDEFLAGPSLSQLGQAVAYVVREFGAPGMTVRLVRQDLPAGWRAAGWGPAEPFSVELARSAYDGEFVAQLTYDGGTAWGADGAVWWDRHLQDGSAELWRVRERGQRELIGAGALMPVASPDGNYVACRTSSGLAVYSASGSAGSELVRTYAARFSEVTWLPDSSGLLLIGDEGITSLSLDGQARRLTSFPARPGCFVEGGRYWFVSNRQL
jgi:hypothetical protein